MTRSILIDELTQDEGLRRVAYDDATGVPLTKGSTLQGHPTIGIGRALDVHGITKEEALYLLGNDIDSTLGALRNSLAWFDSLDDVRQRVLVNMAFNMGVAGLLKFEETLRYIGEDRFELASRAMEDSNWYRQVGDRARRLVAMMRTGMAAT